MRGRREVVMGTGPIPKNPQIKSQTIDFLLNTRHAFLKWSSKSKVRSLGAWYVGVGNT